jgi:histone arginine demethylase JMJD6
MSFLLVWLSQVGSDDDGYPVRMRFDHFMRYCVSYPHHAPSDDSPLYIFDGTYGDRSSSKALLGQYSVPHLFSEDIFGLVGERRRPPYR